MKFKIRLFLLFFLFVIACTISPAKQEKVALFVSEEEEISLGKRLDKIVLSHYGYYNSLKLQDYIDSIGQELVKVSDRPHLIYRFKVLNSAKINTFSMPGGYVYVTRGLLSFLNSEAELAYALAYEIGHVSARHAIKKYTKTNNFIFAKNLVSIFFTEFKNFDLASVIFDGIVKGYGSEFELEAYTLSIRYMLKAGYNPGEIKNLLKTLSLIKESGINDAKRNVFFNKFSSFLPEIESKIYNIGKYNNLKIGVEEYKKQIENLIFGDNPEEGVLKNNTFKHQSLLFAFTYPAGWEIENRQKEIWAKHETQDFFIQITFYTLDKYTLTGNAAKKVAKKLHLNLISGKETKINGLSAFVGDYKGKHFALEKIRVKAAFIAMEDKIYYILCFSKEMEFSFVKDYFEQVIKSFRRLSFHEIKKANPYKLKLYQVKKGDTWKCISHKFLKGKINYKTLALLNGNSPEEGPYKDKIIKIVTY